MHTMWKGSISFGLVNIPIKMFAATEDKDIKFRYLHEECGTPVKNIRTCPSCEREIEWGDVVKGYEYQPGQFVLMSDEEFEEIAPQRTKTIDILHFVNLEEIDPIYFNKSYYLAPEDTGGKAYALLRQAMRETGKIAVAKMIIRSTQSLAVLRTYGDVLVMESIFYPEEVRGVSQLPGIPAGVGVDENEMKVATQLINSLAVPFEPEQYQNDYRIALQNAIEQKIEGQEITHAAEPQREQIHDLMKALQESLNVVRKQPEEEKKVVGGNEGGHVEAVAKAEPDEKKEAAGGGDDMVARLAATARAGRSASAKSGSVTGEGVADAPEASVGVVGAVAGKGARNGVASPVGEAPELGAGVAGAVAGKGARKGRAAKAVKAAPDESQATDDAGKAVNAGSGTVSAAAAIASLPNLADAVTETKAKPKRRRRKVE